MVPIVYDAQVTMTQMPVEEETTEEDLKVCHEHLEVSRAMASSLQHAALQATHTTMAKRTRRGNSNKEEESRNAKKLEWLVAEQKKVVQVDEKALIQAAVVTRRKRLSCVAAERSGQVDAALEVDEKEVVEKEDGNVVNTNTQEVMTIKNAHVNYHPTMNSNLRSTAAQDINDEKKEDAASLARTDKQEAISKDDDDDETIKNADIDATTTSKTRTAAQDPPPPPSLKKKIPLSSQEVYDISADDVREKEAADRSGEWILQQIEEEEKEGEHMKKKQNKDTSPETNSKQVGRTVRRKGTKKKETKGKENQQKELVALKKEDCIKSKSRTTMKPKTQKVQEKQQLKEAAVVDIQTDQAKHQQQLLESNANGTSSSSTTPPPPSTVVDNTNDTTPTKTTPTMIKVGTIVQVQSRTWPGVNKPGGVARITKIHSLSSNVSYDVTYVLGGKEKNVDACFISLPESTISTPCKEEESGGGRRSGRKCRTRDFYSPLIKEEGSSVKKRKSIEALSSSPLPKCDDAASMSSGSSKRRKSRNKENDVTCPDVIALLSVEDTTGLSFHKKKDSKKKKNVKQDVVVQTERKSAKKRGLSKKGLPPTEEEEDEKVVTTTSPKKQKMNSSSMTTTTDVEKVQNADAWYAQLFENNNKNKKWCMVTSSLVDYEKEMIRHFCLEMKRSHGVSIRETKDFQPNKTSICITPPLFVPPFQQQKQQKESPNKDTNKDTTGVIDTVSKHRTMKAMRASLACVPIVTINWITSCLEEKKIVVPKGDLCIRTLPTKLDHLLKEQPNNNNKDDDDDDDDTKMSCAPTARLGVSNYASLRYTQQEYLPLVNASVFLSGPWSKQSKGPKKSDVLTLLKEAGASVLTSAGMTSKLVKELQKQKQKKDSLQRTVVILCDESTTDDGCGITGGLLKDLKAVIGSNVASGGGGGSCGILVVNFNWLFDCVTCGELLGANDYEPKIPIAKSLWELGTKK